MGLRYNTVDLSFTLTENHSSEPEQDPSGADVLYTRTAIRVKAIVGPGLYPAVVGETPAATAARIRHLLTTPRRRLTYSVGSTVMIDTAGDDANGPMPDAGAFSITHITEGSFEVHFAVVVRLTHCTAGLSRGWLSLKWSDKESVGADWTKTRRRTGYLIVSRQDTVNADDRRNLVVPAVPPGFRREEANYELSEDGLRLRFSFTDRQLHSAVPTPALKVTGSQVETVPLRGGLRRGELSVRLQAPPGTDKRDLLNAALRLAMPRVYSSGVLRDKGGYMIGGGVRESLNDDETAVELSLSWYIKPEKGRLTGDQQPSELRSLGAAATLAGTIIANPAGALAGKGVAGLLASGNQTPEGRSRAAVPVVARWLGTPTPGAEVKDGVPTVTRGVGLAAAIRPFAALLNDPCGSTSELRAGAEPSLLVGTGPGGSVVTAQVGNPQPDDQDGVADDPLPGVWEFWRMTYTFLNDSGYGVIPSTVPGESGSMVRYGNPEKKLLIKWSLKRTGAAPPLPEPKVPRPGGWTGDGTHDPNWVGRTSATTYENVELASDDVTFVYVACGEAEFDCLNPAKATEAYPCPPWLAPSARPATPTTLSSTPLPAPPAGQLPGNPFGPYPGQYANPFNTGQVNP